MKKILNNKLLTLFLLNGTLRSISGIFGMTKMMHLWATKGLDINIESVFYFVDNTLFISYFCLICLSYYRRFYQKPMRLWFLFSPVFLAIILTEYFYFSITEYPFNLTRLIARLALIIFHFVVLRHETNRTRDT